MGPTSNALPINSCASLTPRSPWASPRMLSMILQAVKHDTKTQGQPSRLQMDRAQRSKLQRRRVTSEVQTLEGQTDRMAASRTPLLITDLLLRTSSKHP